MSCLNHRTTHSDYIQYWQSCEVQCSVVQYLLFTFYSLSYFSPFLFSSPLVPFFSLFPTPSLLTSSLYYTITAFATATVLSIFSSLSSSVIASYTILSLTGHTDGWCTRYHAGFTASTANLVLFIHFKFNTIYVSTYTLYWFDFDFSFLALLLLACLVMWIRRSAILVLY